MLCWMNKWNNPANIKSGVRFDDLSQLIDAQDQLSILHHHCVNID